LHLKASIILKSIFFQGYTDEPIGKVLREIGMSQCVLMDRWRVKVTPNEDVTDDHVDRSKPNVPLNVINNYFSFGVDAHIALEFHEAREAHPERFNSRLRNKMYYGQMGGKDLILRQYRNLSQWVTLECDGQDFTGKLRDAGCHAVLFLNIPRWVFFSRSLRIFPLNSILFHIPYHFITMIYDVFS